MSDGRANWSLLRKLLVVAAVMFGFGFALVPFYKKICEVTGVNNILQADVAEKNTQIDLSRNVTIEFDANVRGDAWLFRPMQKSLVVHPGEITQIAYEVKNKTDRQIIGQAIPSYGPQLAGQFFKKLECFCFTTQTLKPNETKQMPVVFVIDRALPKDVNTITLSYTFFELEGANAQGRKPQGNP